MDIIYTCPKCGTDLQTEILATNPPQSQYRCYSCGWSYTLGHRENPIRAPFPTEAINITNTGVEWSDIDPTVLTPTPHEYYNPDNLAADMPTQHIEIGVDLI